MPLSYNTTIQHFVRQNKEVVHLVKGVDVNHRHANALLSSHSLLGGVQYNSTAKLQKADRMPAATEN